MWCSLKLRDSFDHAYLDGGKNRLPLICLPLVLFQGVLGVNMDRFLEDAKLRIKYIVDFGCLLFLIILMVSVGFILRNNTGLIELSESVQLNLMMHFIVGMFLLLVLLFLDEKRTQEKVNERLRGVADYVEKLRAYTVPRFESLSDLIEKTYVNTDVNNEAPTVTVPTEPVKEMPLSTKQMNTLLSIIGVLCKEAKYDYASHSKTAAAIQSKAAQIGVHLGETTIEGYLKKIPNALAARKK